MRLSLVSPRDVAHPLHGVAPAGWRRMPRRLVSRLDRSAVALIALGFVLRLLLVLRGWPRLDSDEAIVGLMARHILYAGERPIFFYGQHYMGPLEAYFAAAVFRVTGAGTLGLRIVTIALTLGFLVCVYLLGRAAYGRVPALLTLGLLAVGPAFGLLRELPAIGGYQETLLLCALVSLLVYARLRRPFALRSSWPEQARIAGGYALIGVLAGLGIWSDELVLPFAVASVAVLLVARWREALGLPILALVCGIFVGGAPFWIFNLTHHGQTFAELARANAAPGGVSPVPALFSWFAQVGSTLTIALPAIMGSPHVCVSPGAVYAGYTSYPPVAVSSPAVAGCSILNSAYSLALLAVFVAVAVELGRAALPFLRRAPSVVRLVTQSSAASSQEVVSTPLAPERQAALWLRAVLLVSALATLTLYSLSARTTASDQFVVVRYLLPLYVALPVVVGYLWERAGRLMFQIGAYLRGVWVQRRRAVPVSRGQTLSEWLAAALVAALVLFFVVGAVEVIVTASDGTYALPLPPADARLIHELDALGVRAYYADYWTCYNLVFESGERLHCSTLGRVERYPPYAALLSAAPHPAYVLHLGSPQDTNFADYTAGLNLPHAGYVRVPFEGYAIYYVPGAQTATSPRGGRAWVV